jgi:hypothetical protein
MLLRSEQLLLNKQGYAAYKRSGNLSHQLLSFIGTLDPKLLGEADVEIPTADLTGEQRTRLYAWLEREYLKAREPLTLTDLQQYPVEAFRGENPNGVVRLSFEEKPGVVRRANIPGWPEPYQDAETLAKQFAYWTEKSQWKFSAADLDKSDYVFGAIKRNDIRFYCTPDLFIGHTLDDGTTKADAEPVPYSKLPTAFRARVKQLYEELTNG